MLKDDLTCFHASQSSGKSNAQATATRARRMTAFIVLQPIGVCVVRGEREEEIEREWGECTNPATASDLLTDVDPDPTQSQTKL